jgi:hypothetical protein
LKLLFYQCTDDALAYIWETLIAQIMWHINSWYDLSDLTYYICKREEMFAVNFKLIGLIGAFYFGELKSSNYLTYIYKIFCLGNRCQFWVHCRRILHGPSSDAQEYNHDGQHEWLWTVHRAILYFSVQFICHPMKTLYFFKILCIDFHRGTKVDSMSNTVHSRRCQVPCGSRKKLPPTSLQCRYIFWSFGIINANTINCWELSTAQAGARGREGCCTYSLSLMYRLNQTESAILMLYCCDKCFRRITLFPEFCTSQKQVSSAVWQP